MLQAELPGTNRMHSGGWPGKLIGGYQSCREDRDSGNRVPSAHQKHTPKRPFPSMTQLLKRLQNKMSSVGPGESNFRISLFSCALNCRNIIASIGVEDRKNVVRSLAIGPAPPSLSRDSLLCFLCFFLRLHTRSAPTVDPL